MFEKPLLDGEFVYIRSILAFEIPNLELIPLFFHQTMSGGYQTVADTDMIRG